MNIAMINCGLVGSTGKIMRQTANRTKKDGHNVLLAVSGQPVNKETDTSHIVHIIGSELSRKINVLLGRITGLNGCFAYFATKRFIRQLESFSPDILHLHNLHESYINLPLLFKYIKKHDVGVVWTFHDCWPFTGHCAQFEHTNCEKWKGQCKNCPEVREYPQSFFDNSSFMFKWKKRWFTGIRNLTVVTPSQWLARLVERSFLREYPIKVINNGIDLNIFKPTDSDFRERHRLQDKVVLLGVAFGWGDRKGLDVFIHLAGQLDSKYQIVLVGTDNHVDKLLPDNVISIHRTNNQQELAEIYTAADLFVNPTRQDNYPTVNLEAIACGTPVLTFNTGGSPEIVDNTCGAVVEKDDVNALQAEIIRICERSPYSKEACLRKAESFDKSSRFKEYTSLYQSMMADLV